MAGPLTLVVAALTMRRMGVLSRMLIPRSVRRAAHPVRTVKRAATPKTIKKMQRSLHPVDNAVYGVTRKLNTKPRSRAKAYTHGSCPVRHRTPEAAQNCRNT